MKITLLSVTLVACSTATWSRGVDQETATVEWLLLGSACFLWRHRTSSFCEARWAWFEVCLRYLFMWRENTDLEDDLSTDRVFFNLKRRNLSSNPCEVASLYFFQLGFLNFLFFFSSTSAAGSLRFQFWNPLLLFALASLWQNQEGTSSSESLFELNFDPSRSSSSDQKLHN